MQGIKAASMDCSKSDPLPPRPSVYVWGPTPKFSLLFQPKR